MTNIWLRPNRRVITWGMTVPIAMIVIGLLLAWSAVSRSDWTFVGGIILVAIGIVLLGALIASWRRPRIGFRDGNVLFFLRSGRPIATPVEAVEAFFVGQGPAMLPGRSNEDLQTINLVARISQRSERWQHVEVARSLGHWCDGYVIIRGTWCEPLNEDTVRRLNQQLYDARQATQDSVA